MKLIKMLFWYFFAFVSIFFMGRFALFVFYFDRFSANNSIGDSSYWLTFLYGLRMDAIIACATLIIPLILLSLFPKGAKVFISRFLSVYFLAVFLLFIYIENATLPFFSEYDVRPNFLFVEYLVYPQEVFSMIFAAYKIELLIALFIMSVFTYGFTKNKPLHDFTAVFDISYYKRILLFFPLIFLLALGVRSSLGHRPANVSDAMFSNNRIINEITKNSIHSIYCLCNLQQQQIC